MSILSSSVTRRIPKSGFNVVLTLVAVTLFSSWILSRRGHARPYQHASPLSSYYPSVQNDCLLGINSVKHISLYSQNDEDGGLLQTLRCMGGHGTREYFEFGSENGQEVNTRVLRELYGWKGHLLDGGNENPEIPLHKEFFTPLNIVSLLEKYGVSKTLDVLSIDCDYDDIYIMREILLAGYKPRILITEYNRNFGPEWSVSVTAKPVGKENEVSWQNDCYFGASAHAIIKMTDAFGYKPVWSNGINLIFIRVEIALGMKLQIPDPGNFPHPLEPKLHSSCDGRQWALIDNVVLEHAVNPSLSHEDFVKKIPTVTLRERYHATKNLDYRTFTKI
jgi:hypothetical protein